jgi:hypothetical protein
MSHCIWKIVKALDDSVRETRVVGFALTVDPDPADAELACRTHVMEIALSNMNPNIG